MTETIASRDFVWLSCPRRAIESETDAEIAASRITIASALHDAKRDRAESGQTRTTSRKANADCLAVADRRAPRDGIVTRMGRDAGVFRRLGRAVASSSVSCSIANGRAIQIP